MATHNSACWKDLLSYVPKSEQAGAKTGVIASAIPSPKRSLAATRHLREDEDMRHELALIFFSRREKFMRNATWKSMCLATSLVMAGWASSAHAEDKTWTPTSGNDFYNNANWIPTGAPGGDDNALILDPAVTAVINFTGTRELGSFHLGTTGATGGNVDFLAGTLAVRAEHDRSHIGDKNSLDSRFVMRGSAVMLFDEPLDGGGGGFGSSGGNQDLEIGAQTGASGAKGLLELRDSAILRISDDLKIGAEANGNGEVLMDGNSQISAGSGVSVSEANPSKGKLTVAGNALLVSGNSAGAGNVAQGVSDEGYFTLSVNSGSTADVLIKDSAKVWARTLQQRSGATNWTIQDNGEFHVFDTFHFAAPNLGVATVVGFGGPVRSSHISGGATDTGFTLVVTGSGKFSIDSALDDGFGSLFKGLALSGGNNQGSLTGGTTSKIELRENASFTIQQNLYMTPLSGNSTLELVGPNVDAEIRGNLYMSYDPIFQQSTTDPSTLSAVITGGAHSTLSVLGEADIANGSLAVKLNGYTPHGGETYTLLTAGSITGTNFVNTDFSMASLPAGLSWDLTVGATSVVLKVLGSTGLQGDFDGDNDVDGRDFLVWQRGGSPNPLSPGNLNDWRMNFGAGGATSAAHAVPEPSGLWLAGVVIGIAGALRKSKAART
jgi:hypothetical protein